MTRKLFPWGTLFILVVGFACCTPPLRAETGTTRARSGGWGPKDRYQDLWKSGAAATERGDVLSTEEFVPYEGMEPGVQLKLRGTGGDLFVHLGPRWFMMENDVTFTRGEPLVVVGVKIRFQGKPTVIATELQQGPRKVILRDLAGKPRWLEGAGGHRMHE